MMDYVAETLDGSGEIVNPTEKDFFGGKFHYVKVGDDGVVLMIDRKFGETNFNKAYNQARNQFNRVASIFYKDGKNFFRSAAEKNYFKKEHELSLKYYNDDAMHKMMLITPEEKKIANRGNIVEYYQPNSKKLDEKIVAYRYGSVIYNYDHIPSEERHTPVEVESKKLRIWEGKKELPLELKLKKDYLVSR